MQISWVPGETIELARGILAARSPRWDEHFTPTFTAPPAPAAVDAASWPADWPTVAEHVARAERVSQVVRDGGIEVARARFGDSPLTIEAVTLAAALHFGEAITLADVRRVLTMPIDPLVFYAPFLELLVALGGDDRDATLRVYEQFANAYTVAMRDRLDGVARTGAVWDGLADVYATLGRLDRAEHIYETRHQEDVGDVAIALSASRAFLQAGAISHAVRWLEIGAARARSLGRHPMASKLDAKAAKIRSRLEENEN